MKSETELSKDEYLAYLVADPHAEGNVFAATMHEARYRYAAALLPANAHALDIGCATGYGAQILLEKASRVSGTDLHEVAISEARRRHADDARLDFFQGDATRLPLADHSVDGAVAFDVIEHLERPQELLAEMNRVVRPGGPIVLSTPNKLASDLQAGQIFEFHQREYYLSDFREELARRFSSFEVFGQYPSFTDDIRRGLGAFRQRSRFWFVPSAIRSRIPRGPRAFVYRFMGLGASGQDDDQIARLSAIGSERVDVAHDFVAVCRAE